MKNQELTLDLFTRLESLDTVPAEPLPAGWSRRNWVQRDAIAFAEVVRNITQNKEDES